MPRQGSRPEAAVHALFGSCRLVDIMRDVANSRVIMLSLTGIQQARSAPREVQQDADL